MLIPTCENEYANVRVTSNPYHGGSKCSHIDLHRMNLGRTNMRTG